MYTYYYKVKVRNEIMATVEEATAAVVAAVDELEAAVATPTPDPEPAKEDAVRAVVEAQLLSEGWSAPAPAATEEPEGETPTPSE